MKVIDIEIKDIISNRNIRGDQRNKLEGLMSSLAQHELIHPIGVKQDGNKWLLAWGNLRTEAARKLGWTKIAAVILDKDIDEKEFRQLNFIENEQRYPVTASDRGRFFYEMKRDFGMTNSELAARLNIPVSRVKDGLNAFNAPDEFKDKCAPFLAGGRAQKKGQIAASYYTKISTIANRYKLNKESVALLYELARQDGINVIQFDIIGKFLKLGCGLEEAIENAKLYKPREFRIPLRDDELNKYLKKYNTTIQKLALDIFRGKVIVNFTIPEWGEEVNIEKYF